MKSQQDKTRIISMLTQCRRDITDEEEKKEIDVEIEVIKGNKKPSDYSGKYKKFALIAEKWLQGKVYDDELFAN